MSRRSRFKRMREKKKRRFSPPAARVAGLPKLMRRMARRHLDVLQNIECALTSAWRDDQAVDDAAVLEALQAMRYGAVPEGPRARDVLARLESVRELRTDVALETWQDGLRVVADSVRNHSTLRPGDVGYLTFVSSFVP